MPWTECSLMSSRLEFVRLAGAHDANISALCAAFSISRKTGYKWLARYAAGGDRGLVDRPRRPKNSPRRSDAEIEATVQSPVTGSDTARNVHHA